MAEKGFVDLIFLYLSALLGSKIEKRDANGKVPIGEPLLPACPVNWH